MLFVLKLSQKKESTTKVCSSRHRKAVNFEIKMKAIKKSQKEVEIHLLLAVLSTLILGILEKL
jgi:hypothetical protein